MINGIAGNSAGGLGMSYPSAARPSGPGEKLQFPSQRNTAGAAMLQNDARNAGGCLLARRCAALRPARSRCRDPGRAQAVDCDAAAAR
jgi:hypothetical protein